MIKAGRIIHSLLSCCWCSSRFLIFFFWWSLDPIIAILLLSSFATLGDGFLAQDISLHSYLHTMVMERKIFSISRFFQEDRHTMISPLLSPPGRTECLQSSLGAPVMLRSTYVILGWSGREPPKQEGFPSCCRWILRLRRVECAEQATFDTPQQNPMG